MRLAASNSQLLLGHIQTELAMSKGHSISFPVDLSIYPLPILQTTAHRFTSDYFVDIKQLSQESAIVTLNSKSRSTTHEDLEGEFKNCLLDDRLRERVTSETRAIRELLVKKALAGALTQPSNKSQETSQDESF
jgi:His-Xaa-Ser system protein HxsD